MVDGSCIYCGGVDLSDEHYLPACLGRFKGYEPLRGRICLKCNGECGKLDEQLCRSSYAAFFRQYLGIKGRKKHKSKPSPFYRGSAGGKRISFKGKSLETGELVELEYRDGQAMPLRHMLITTEDKCEYVLPITDEMKDPVQLKEAFKRLVGDRKANAEIYCAPDEKSWVENLVGSLKFEKQTPWKIEEGPNTFNKTEINFVITERFFRCVAKIAFHHFLQRMPQFTGMEDEFQGIREFIINEGPLERCKRFISRRPTQLITALQQGRRLKPWAHLVTVQVDYFNVLGSVQLFVGPECIWPIFDVHIGKNPSPIDYTDATGSFFRYYQKEERTDYDGELSELPHATLLGKLT